MRIKIIILLLLITVNKSRSMEHQLNLYYLPQEILYVIYSLLDHNTLINFSATNQYLRNTVLNYMIAFHHKFSGDTKIVRSIMTLLYQSQYFLLHTLELQKEFSSMFINLYIKLYYYYRNICIPYATTSNRSKTTKIIEYQLISLPPTLYIKTPGYYTVSLNKPDNPEYDITLFKNKDDKEKTLYFIEISPYAFLHYIHNAFPLPFHLHQLIENNKINSNDANEKNKIQYIVYIRPFEEPFKERLFKPNNPNKMVEICTTLTQLKNHKIIFNPNIRNYYNSSPLHYAFKNNDIETASKLLKSGYNAHALDVYGETPLYYALKNNNHAVRQLLIDYGLVNHPRL